MTDHAIEHDLTITRHKDDGTDVEAHCVCGEFSFRGDWDDLCDAWGAHDPPPFSSGPILLSRAAGKRVEEIKAQPRKVLPARPIPIEESKERA